MKVYKLEIMVVDTDEIGGASIAINIADARYPNRCIAPQVVSIEERDIGEFPDEHPLNQSRTWRTEFRKLFAASEEDSIHVFAGSPSSNFKTCMLCDQKESHPLHEVGP